MHWEKYYNSQKELQYRTVQIFKWICNWILTIALLFLNKNPTNILSQPIKSYLASHTKLLILFRCRDLKVVYNINLVIPILQRDKQKEDSHKRLEEKLRIETSPMFKLLNQTLQKPF